MHGNNVTGVLLKYETSEGDDEAERENIQRTFLFSEGLQIALL